MPLDWGQLASDVRFYFGEDLGSLTLPQLRDRQAFLYNDGASKSKGDGSGLASAARAVMSKTGRKSLSLNEIMGAF